MNDPEVLIRTDRLGMSFPGGQAALRQVQLSVKRGEFVSIVGPSGCGKSTLLRVVAGLIEPTAGTVSIDGRAPIEAGRVTARVAFVFQDPTLLPWRSVVGNIRLPLELQGVSHSESEKPVEESLGLIGLTAADARKSPRMLSGGMRMRVSLARSLVTEPELLLLDEPFGALDDIMRQRLNEDLLGIWSEKRWTGLFVTHNVAEAVFLSQRILVMSQTPGTIAREVEVPFDFPRAPELRADPDFARLTGEVSRHLREATT